MTHTRATSAVVSLVLGIIILLAKIWAWWLTNSAAVLSDALESNVNVAAAMFALFSVRLAQKPPDDDHPYGHGKVEYVSAAFEGGLVMVAAAWICFEAVKAWLVGTVPKQLDVGLLVTAGAGALNLGLGLWLVKQGKELRSAALQADGKHVLSDVWSTIAVLIGLGLVKLTGLWWLDPLCAVVVAAMLLRVGGHLVMESVQGLLDREDPDLVRRIVRAFHDAAEPGFSRIHHVRAIHSGHTVHVDAHVHAPSVWTVEEAHDASERLGKRMAELLGIQGDVALHLDPDSVTEPPQHVV